jgi:hypothetical protein
MAPRLPIQPLVNLVDAHGGLRACGVWDHTGTPNRIRWARRLLRAYSRSRQRGWIGLHAADELSVKALSMHPAEIWGADWWDA